MRTYKLKTKIKKTHSLAMVFLASLLFGPVNATDGPSYKPAHLLKGYCGSDHITIHVNHKKEVVPCADLDTYTGKGSYDRKMCYHRGHGYKHSYSHKKHKHCETVTHYYQLPVIKIEKLAYKHKKVLWTKHSPAFPFSISTNGGYQNNFHLKSKQKAYLVAKRDTYTIAEHAPHYKTRIVCNGHTYHDYKVDIEIKKAGQQVYCVFHNRKPGHHKPVKNRAPHHGACYTKGYYHIQDAKKAYANSCSYMPRKDCDLIDGKWYCSSHIIGNNAPGLKSR